MRRRVLPVPVCLFSVVLASMFASTAFAQYARVSIASDGTEANFSSVTPSISDDGRFVAFSSAATNLVTGDTNGRADVYLHDRDSDGDSIYDEPGARTTVRVSITTAGEQFGGSCFMPVISGNGRFVAFLTNEAMPPSLPGGNGFIQTLRWDRLTGAIVIVTQVAPGVLGNGNSASPDLSNDGRRIVFRSDATNFAAAPHGELPNIFVRDMDTGVTRRLSAPSPATVGDPGLENTRTVLGAEHQRRRRARGVLHDSYGHERRPRWDRLGVRLRRESRDRDASRGDRRRHPLAAERRWP